jgi:sortase A
VSALRSRRILLAAVLVAGVGLVAAGGWIPLKAQLAQRLLVRAWERGQQGEGARPWPWADTRALARLRVPRLDIDQIVLAGASGSTLAFAPGHLDGSALPGEIGTSVLSGHRDTHFAFLKRLAVGDTVEIDTVTGTRRYRVEEAQVVDTRTTPLRLQRGTEEMLLLTCYPFDVVAATGPLRYRVRAVPVDDAAGAPAPQRDAVGSASGLSDLRAAAPP